MNEQESVPVVKLEECNLNNYHLIDVRSPGEFEAFHIDDAYNLPIFTNDERAEVGTTYKQIGKEEAKELGLSIVSPKLSDMFNQMNTLNEKEKKPFLIYCARGGMRSRSVATVMKMMGLPCFQLEGGIRSYRESVVETLDRFCEMNRPFIVLEGNTGTRKTDFLEVLQEEGYPVLNLEKMAGHRGSIFGQVGLESRTQKQFEQALANRLRELERAPYYLIESESKRIGRVMVPDWILMGKDKGHRIHITLPFEQRVEYICEVYQPEQFDEEIGEALVKLQKRLQPEIAEAVMEAYEGNDYKEIVRHLLTSYYDPRYNHAAQRYESSVTDLHIEQFEKGLEDMKQAIERVKTELNILTT